MATFINLTPHDINILTPSGLRTIEPHDYCARVNASTRTVDTIDDIPIVEQTFGDVNGLPDPAPDTFYLVSSIVLNALDTPRPDVLAPATGANHGVMRDQRGNIQSVTRLIKRTV